MLSHTYKTVGYKGCPKINLAFEYVEYSCEVKKSNPKSKTNRQLIVSLRLVKVERFTI